RKIMHTETPRPRSQINYFQVHFHKKNANSTAKSGGRILKFNKLHHRKLHTRNGCLYIIGNPYRYYLVSIYHVLAVGKVKKSILIDRFTHMTPTCLTQNTVNKLKTQCCHFSKSEFLASKKQITVM